jgi:hypothetical protein
MTIQAIQIRVLATFVAKTSRGNATAPARKHRSVGAHGRGERRIEINFRRCGWLQLVANLAVLRLGRDA